MSLPVRRRHLTVEAVVVLVATLATLLGLPEALPGGSGAVRGQSLSEAAVGSVAPSVSARGSVPAGSHGGSGTEQAGLVKVGSISPVPPGAVVVARPDPRETLTLALALRPAHQGALASFVRQVSSPGSPLYRHFLAPGQFARRFGPTSSTIAAAKRELSALGFRAGPVLDHLDVFFTTTAGRADSVLKADLATLRLPSGRLAMANLAAPELPRALAERAQAVLGLTTVPRALASAAPVSAVALEQVLRQHATTTTASGSRRSAEQGSSAVPASSPHIASRSSATGPQPCAAASANASPGGSYTANQLASAYGYTSAYSEGYLGQGVTFGVVSRSVYSTSDVAAFQSCYGTDATVNVVPVAGGTTSQGALVEADGDIETIIGFDPEATIDFYEVGPTSSFFDQTYAAIAQADKAQIVSTSYSLCELDEPASNAAATATVLDQMAAQGQTVVVASGDNGAQECLPPGGSGGNVAAIACPSATSCLAGGTNGGQGEVVAVDGSSSSPAVAPGTGAVTGVACMTASSCVATGNDVNTHVYGVLRVSSGSPGTLEQVSDVFSLAGAVCAGSTTCYALGENGQLQGMVVPLVSGTPSSPETVGQASGSPASGTDLISGSCMSSSSCIVVGQQAGEGVVVGLSGGSLGTPIDVSGTTSLTSVSCGAPGSCVAVGSSSGGPVSVSITNGSPGAPVSLTGLASASAVGCYSQVACIVGGSVVGPSDSNVSQSDGALLALQSGTPGGAVMELGGTGAIDAVACAPGTTTCLTGGSSTGSFYGVVEQVDSGVPGGPYATLPVSSSPVVLQGVACTSQSVCYAVGSSGGSGVVVPIDDGTQGSTHGVSGTTGLYSISCESSSTCLAVGTDNGQGVVVPIQDGTPGTPELSGSASAVPVSTLYGVTCPSSTSCLAVGTGDGYGVVEQVSGTAPGSASDVPSSETLLSVACATATSCYAVGFGDGYGVVVPVSGGTPGSAQEVGNNATIAAIACTTSSSCVAVGAELQGYQELGIVLGVGGGSIGAPGVVTLTGLGSAFDAISCEGATSAGPCVAVGSDVLGAGAELYISSSGVPSELELVDGPSNLAGLACPTTSTCVAVAGDEPNSLAGPAPASSNDVVSLGNGLVAPPAIVIPAALTPGYPATQPDITAVGGTTLEQPGPPPVQTVWGGSGGGVSSLFLMPAWQEASGVPGVITSLSGGAPCSAPTGSYCREVPDVSLDANADQGYLIYSQGAWEGFGGTSSSTPAFAAMLGLAEDACGGGSSPERLGLVNPALYGLAAVDPPAFDQPSSGDTDVSGTSGSLYAAPGAGQGYAMATGLGSPVGGKLIAGLCGVATSSSITASTVDSAGTATVTVHLADAAGPLPGVQVRLVQTLAPGESGTASSVVSPTTATTDGSGVASFSVSDSSEQEVVYRAVDTTAGGAETASSASVDFTVTSSQPPPTSAPSEPSAFVALSPARIVDTRCAQSPRPAYLSATYCSSLPAANASLGIPETGKPITVQVAGIDGVPASSTSAVVLNVTATGESAGGYLSVFPGGASAPPTSNLNFTAGEDVANMVTVGVGARGTVEIAVGPSGTTSQVVVDLEGYYVPPSGASGAPYQPLSPARIADTRCSASPQPGFCRSEYLPANNASLPPLSANSPEPVQVTGLDGVPATGVTAVVLSVSATGYEEGGYLSVYPASNAAPPSISNLNFAPGRGAVSNLVVVEPGPGGFFDVVSDVATDFVADVEGYFTSSGTSGALFSPESEPVRICDTRSTGDLGGSGDVTSGVSGQCANSGSALAPGGSMVVQVTGLGGTPAGATAAALDVAVTGDASGGYLTIYPGGTRPVVAGVDWGPGETVASMAMVELSSSGAVMVYNGSPEALNVIVDLEGYLASPSSG